MKNKPTTPPAPVPATPELALKAHEGTPHYGDYGQPPLARTETLPAPDQRAAGGNVFDLRNEQTTL